MLLVKKIGSAVCPSIHLIAAVQTKLCRPQNTSKVNTSTEHSPGEANSH
jgi:hypothetical protein